jgi:hypothetical protein
MIVMVFWEITNASYDGKYYFILATLIFINAHFYYLKHVNTLFKVPVPVMKQNDV